MLEKSELFLALDESQWSYATGIIGPRVVVVDPLCHERLGTKPQGRNELLFAHFVVTPDSRCFRGRLLAITSNACLVHLGTSASCLLETQQATIYDWKIKSLTTDAMLFKGYKQNRLI